jgi:hypothetical protein
MRFPIQRIPLRQAGQPQLLRNRENPVIDAKRAPDPALRACVSVISRSGDSCPRFVSFPAARRYNGVPIRPRRRHPKPVTIPSPKSDLGISIEDLYRLSVAQYHVLARTGIVDEDAPVELLEGWLVCK